MAQLEPEKLLLDRAASGDAGALAELLVSHAAVTRRVISGRIPTRWQSLLSTDDVMQQTYADAISDIRQFVNRGKGAFPAWLLRLAECNLRDAVRMLSAAKRGGWKERVPLAAARDSVDDLCDLLSGDATTPSRAVARAEAGDDLKQAIASLPSAYRQTVELYDLECRPIEEVSKMLNRSPGAVYMLRARAHDRLRRQLGAASDYFTDPGR